MISRRRCVWGLRFEDAILLAWLDYFQKSAPVQIGPQEKPIVGLIPKAQKPIAFDGKLTGWDGAFVTPVHVALSL